MAARSETLVEVAEKGGRKGPEVVPDGLRRRLRKTARAGRALVSRLLPQWLRSRVRNARFDLRLARNYLYDFGRFRRHSANRASLSRENLRALITMDYHRIEKGLSLREPRVGFGAWFMPRLFANLEAYRTAHGADQVVFVTVNALTAYVAFNEARGHDVALVREGLAKLVGALGDEAAAGGREGGVHRLSAEEVRQGACRDLDAFFRTRHSIRHFVDAPVPRALVEKAVSMALHTPSVCNRESWRVHVYSDADSKQAVLRHQNGNRGFGDQAAHVLIVTTDIQSFTSVGERNQAWIDGGMFAMSIIWALHSLGLGTCCLNFCVEKETDAALRAAAGIPEPQAVIMMIAVGSLPDEFAVAQSPRKPVGEVIVGHGPSPTDPD